MYSPGWHHNQAFNSHSTFAAVQILLCNGVYHEASNFCVHVPVSVRLHQKMNFLVKVILYLVVKSPS